MSDEKKDTSGVTVTDSSILLTLLPPWSRNRPDGLVDSVKASATSTLVANLISESRRLIAVQADVESEPDVAVVDTVVPMEERDVLGDGRAADSGLPNLETFGNALGRYEQMGPLGAGGMGTVTRVKDHMLNRTLAMKTLHTRLLDNDGLVIRFIHEAQVVSQLQHPNIMPVYDIGVQPSGQLYFTMAEIQGESLDYYIKRVHSARRAEQSAGQQDDWNLYRLISVFHDVCKAIAYANERGVIHRDLKPANIMIGALGEVLVVDWGLAKVIGSNDSFLDEIVTAKTDSSVELTMLGSIYGTIGYLAPELATADGGKPCPTTDVYALGAILYEVLTGVRAFPGMDPAEVLKKVLMGKIRPFDTAALPADPLGDESESDAEQKRYVSCHGARIPRVLAEVCLRSLSLQPRRRFQSVRELVDLIGGWLDGRKRQETALGLVESAQRLEAQIEKGLKTAVELETEAEEMINAVDAWADESQKIVGWALQDEAQSLRLKSGSLRIQQIQLWRNALAHKSNLPAAHLALAMRFQSMHREAERAGHLLEAERTKVVMTEHVKALPPHHPQRKELVQYLKGEGALSLRTTPSNARVQISRFITRNRRLVLDRAEPLGTTPVDGVSLKKGAYLVHLEADGFHDVVYPIYMDRVSNLDGKNPEGLLEPIELLPLDTLGPDDCYVPAGWCRLGGDPNTSNSLPRLRVWIDGFVMRRFSVTNEEYLVFLNSLVTAGRPEEALEHVPREQSSSVEEFGQMAYSQTEDGLFELETDADAGLWHPQQPVTLIQWRSARAYAEWLAQKTGMPWRLPLEFEWEKAARGVDGRFYPWGNTHDPSWSCMKDSHPGEIRMQSVDSYPVDESVYGVRGTAGNTRDWCLDRFEENGPALHNGRLMMPSPSDLADPGFKSTRGGSYGNSASRARSADRDWWFPNRSYIGRGFRLVWGLADRASEDKGDG